MNPRPQLYAICPLGGSLSGYPKNVTLTLLFVEQACPALSIEAVLMTKRASFFIVKGLGIGKRLDRCDFERRPRSSMVRSID